MNELLIETKINWRKQEEITTFADWLASKQANRQNISIKKNAILSMKHIVQLIISS